MSLALTTALVVVLATLFDVCHGRGGKQIRSTIDGVHVHQPFDYAITPEQMYSIKYHKSFARRYDFLWASEDRMGYAGQHHFQTGICFDILQGWDSEHNRSIDFWKQNHPDWIMYTSDKQTPAWINDGNYRGSKTATPLDFNNDAFMDQLLDEWLPDAEFNHADTLCVDRLSFTNDEGRVGKWVNNQWVQDYSGDAEEEKYYNDIVAWYKRLQDKLAARGSTVKYVIPSFQFSPHGQKQKFIGLLGDIDGVYDEGGFTHRGGNTKSGDWISGDDMYDSFPDWVSRVNMMTGVQESGRPFLSTNLYHNEPTPEEQEYAVASYLIGKNDQATVWTGTENDYGKDVYRQIYSVPIGRPCGKHKVVGTTARRDYSRGVVIVSADHKEPGYWRWGDNDLPLTEYSTGQSWTEKEMRLKPHTGKIFLRQTEDDGCKTGLPTIEEAGVKEESETKSSSSSSSSNSNSGSSSSSSTSSSSNTQTSTASSSSKEKGRRRR